MRIDLDELERTARKATPGPWSWDDRERVVRGSYEMVAFGEPTSEGNHGVVIDAEDAAHIAANSPDRTLALIARIREIETLGTEALNRLATATVALKAEGVIDSTEAAAEVAWIRERHATIAKGTCTP